MAFDIDPLDGGFVGRTSPALGVPAAPGTGMYTRFVAPVALALHGHELLVADAGSGRLWRVDVLLDTMAGIADRRRTKHEPQDLSETISIQAP